MSEEIKYVPNPQFFDPDERLGKICPKCGSHKITYLWRGIGPDEEYDEFVKSGEIALLGCLYGEPFNLGCRDCEHLWASAPMVIPDEKPVKNKVFIIM